MLSPRRLCWILGLGVGGPALAQTDITRPEQSGRVVHRFDFEQPVVGTIRLPEHWVRAQHDLVVPRDRPEFPIWNAAELDGTIAASGKVSVRVPVDGGSASLRLDPGVVPVFPGADYLVAARVRTTNAVNARARLVTRLLDATAAPIEAAERSSRLLTTGGAWVTIGVVVHGDAPSAAFLQIDLEMVQPRVYAHALLGAHQIWNDDHDAAAWFDDVIIMQLPRVELKTPAPFNVFIAGEQPSLTLSVRDLTGEALRAVVTITDDRGRTIETFQRGIQSGRHEETLTPALTELGWYRARLELHNDDSLVGGATTDFAWVLEPSKVTRGSTPGDRALGRTGAGLADRARFGVVVHDLDAGLLESFDELARRMGIGAVTLPAWDESTTGANILDRVQSLVSLVSALSRDWVSATIAFSTVPAELADAAHTDDPFEAMIAPYESVWRPMVDPLFDRLGPRVRRWQVGDVGSESTSWTATGGADLAALDASLVSLVTAPEIVVTGRADRALDVEASGAPAALAGRCVLIPAGFGADGVASLAGLMKAPDTENGLSLVLEALPTATFGQRASVDDLVKRCVATWTAFDADALRSIAIEQPWTIANGRLPMVAPTAMLPAWRNLIERLADRERVGRFSSNPGLHCEILDERGSSGRGGVLVAWRTPVDERDVVLRVPLGDGPVRVFDVYGNERVIEPALRAESTLVHEIPIGDSPIFIEDIDVKMVRFVADFRIDPGLIASVNELQHAELVLRNPWLTPISGTAFVLQPGGASDQGAAWDRSWQIRPRTFRFSIGPGVEHRIPISITFSPYEEAGKRELVLEANVIADREIKGLRLAAPFEIGLDYLQLEASHRFSPTPAGPNVVIEATVTNTGDAPVMAELRVFPPGMARMKLPPVAIGPGQSVVRRFVLENGAELLRGKTVSINASEVDRNGSLNRQVTID
jgi:hypothetical protein